MADEKPGDDSAAALPEAEFLVLSAADRAALFNALLHPPAPSAKLRRAVRSELAHIER